MEDIPYNEMILKGVFVMKKTLIQRRDELRKKLDRAWKEKKLTRTEYNLIWNLTTELNIDRAEDYYKQAIRGVF